MDCYRADTIKPLAVVSTALLAVGNQILCCFAIMSVEKALISWQL